MIFGLMFALLPGFAAVVIIIGDPQSYHGIRRVEVVRLIAIAVSCRGHFFFQIPAPHQLQKVAKPDLASSNLDQIQAAIPLDYLIKAATNYKDTTTGVNV